MRATYRLVHYTPPHPGEPSRRSVWATYTARAAVRVRRSIMAGERYGIIERVR